MDHCHQPQQSWGVKTLRESHFGSPSSPIRTSITIPTWRSVRALKLVLTDLAITWSCAHPPLCCREPPLDFPCFQILRLRGGSWNPVQLYQIYNRSRKMRLKSHRWGFCSTATRALKPLPQIRGRRLLLERARTRSFSCSTGSAWTKAFNLSDIYHNCRVICYPAMLLLLQTEILSWSRDPVWQNCYVFLKSICLYTHSIFQGKSVLPKKSWLELCHSIKSNK